MEEPVADLPQLQIKLHPQRSRQSPFRTVSRQQGSPSENTFSRTRGMGQARDWRNRAPFDKRGSFQAI